MIRQRQELSRNLRACLACLVGGLYLLLVPHGQIVAAELLPQNTSIDAELLEAVKQGWRKAFANSRDIKQLQATVHRTDRNLPNDQGHEVLSFAIKGDKRLFASSHNGHAGDLKAKLSCLRLFDGTNDVTAGSEELFETSASDQEKWALATLDQTAKINPLIARLYEFVWSAGVEVFDSSFSLDYFDFDAPHVEVKEVRRIDGPESELVFLHLLIDRKKYQGANPVGIREVQLTLDPNFDYLPIEARTLGMSGDTAIDHYEYQSFNQSFYLKVRHGKFEATTDGKVVEKTYRKEIRLFSTEAPADSVFRLATYGLTEPKTLAPIDNGFRTWDLILAGVAIIAIGLAVRHYNARRNQ